MFLLLFSYFLLASAFSANKVLLADLPPTFFVGIRMLCAGLIMVAYHYRKSPRLKFSYIKPDVWALLAVAILTTYVPSLLKAYGLRGLPSAKAALIGSCDPFVTAVYAYALWRERLTWKQFWGVTIGFAGIILLLTSSSAQEQSFRSWLMFSWPELAALGSVIVGRYGWILVRSLLRQERYEPTEVNGITMTISGVLALATSLIVDPVSSIVIPSVPKFLAFFSYTVVMGNIVGYGAYAACLKRHSVTLVALAGFTIPLFVALIGWLFLAEPLTKVFAVSAAIIFVGMLLYYYDSLRGSMKRTET